MRMAALSSESQGKSPFMKRVAQWEALIAGVAVLFVTSCSRGPTELAHQIVGADTVIATNIFGARSTYSGPEAARIIRAVRGAKPDAHQELSVTSAAVSSLRFMRGTNFVVEVGFDGELLFTSEGRYVDGSDLLKRAWETIERQKGNRKP